jgi:hypothetical protein
MGVEKHARPEIVARAESAEFGPGGLVRAAKILAGCTYGPETLKIISRAFDGAWADIATHFAGDRNRADAARERLAHAVLIAAAEDSRDHQEIKNTALQIMALSYRGSWLDPDGKFSRKPSS